jgi:hypothetical protein
MASPIKALTEFWRGEVPLGRAFWIWGILGGGAISLASSVLALAIIAGGGPGWLAMIAFGAHVPWNLVLLVGVWRSSDRPEVRKEMAQMARLTIVVWVLALAVL